MHFIYSQSVYKMTIYVYMAYAFVSQFLLVASHSITFLFDRVFQSRYIKERIIENDKNVHLDLAYKNVKTQ